MKAVHEDNEIDFNRRDCGGCFNRCIDGTNIGIAGDSQAGAKILTNDNWQDVNVNEK